MPLVLSDYLMHQSKSGEPAMRYSWVLFDFDGTLADSFPSFLQVFNDIAQAHQFRPIAAHDIEPLRQLPVPQILQQLALPLYKVPRVALSFKKALWQRASDIPLVAGVAELLPQLAAQQVQLALLSSNDQPTITQVLGPPLAGLFAELDCGSSLFGKAARLKRFMRRHAISAADLVYVGDQTTDIQAAQQAGVASVAVTWGYHSEQALSALHPDALVSSIAQLQRYLCGEVD